MNNKSYSVFTVIYIMFIAVALITIIVSICSIPDDSLNSDVCIPFENDWFCENGTKADLSELDNYHFITKTLPDIPRDYTLYFNIKNALTEVTIGDRLVYSSNIYGEEFFGKTTGSDFVKLLISTTDSGKDIVIKINNPYNDGTAKITEMYLGDGFRIMQKNSQKHVFNLCITAVITFIGLVFLIIYIPMKVFKIYDEEILYFGLFAFSVGAFMLTDNVLMQMVFEHEGFYHMLAETFMMFIIIPLFLYMQKIYNVFSRKAICIICSFSVLNFIVCYLLNILKIADYHQTVTITHISYGIGIIFLIITSIKNFSLKDRSLHLHYFGIMFLCLFAAADIIVLRFSSSAENTFFIRIGVLLFMCFEAAELIGEHLKKYRQGIKAQLLSKLAYYDGLTELLNRTSYIEYIRELEKNRTTQILIAVFDVNNLKYVNDNFGHAMGDKLIITAARLIHNSFSDIGNCYRTGGDEFVLIAKSDNVNDIFNNAYEKMLSEIEQINSRSEFPISVSIASGYAVTDETQSLTINEIIEKADANMYENKRIMKAAATA
ncbi:MAG: diguanylate cyclase [Oscillospiraceae bacterium]|nr:diguanylate cyclase [Oscillospiraceae bacterium]